MRFGSTQKLLTFLLALVAALPTIASGEVSPVVAAFCGALAVAGWFLEPPLTGDRRFRRAVTGVIVALFLFGVARVLLGVPVVHAALEFTLLLLGLKLCSRHRHFDYQQIAILAFLMVIGATVTTYDVSYAASFVAFVVLCPPVLALSHLRNEMERRFRHDDNPDSRLALARLLASKRVVTARFVAGTGLLSLPVLLMTALLFVAFPRFGLGFFGRLPGGDSVAGFASQVRIGDIEETRADERVFVRLEPLAGFVERPSRLGIKLRGAVFDTYLDDTWTRSGDLKWKRLSGGGGIHPLTEGFVPDDSPGFDVLLESLEPPYLFVPQGTSVILTEPVASKGLLKSRKLEIDRRGQIRYDDPSKVGIRYRAHLGGAPIPGAVFADPAYLELPPGSERLVEKARAWAGEGDQGRRAARIVGALRRELRYSGRQEGGAGGAESPLDRFLFARRTGTCEHFATAATLMLRAEGIPARMVTGFSSAVWNPIGEYYAVQARSAHAWTEALIDGRWVTLDATPPAQGAAEIAPPSSIALLLDAIRMKWHKHVIGYDASSQMELGMAAARVFGKAGGLGPGAPPWKLVGGAALLAVALLLVWRNRRWLLARARSGSRKKGGRSRSSLEATALYLALERRAAALGVPRRVGQTPSEHLADLAALGPDAVAVSSRIIDRYLEVRFGGGAFSPGERETLERDAKLIEARKGHEG